MGIILQVYLTAIILQNQMFHYFNNKITQLLGINNLVFIFKIIIKISKINKIKQHINTKKLWNSVNIMNNKVNRIHQQSHYKLHNNHSKLWTKEHNSIKTKFLIKDFKALLKQFKTKDFLMLHLKDFKMLRL